jgi:methionine-rich copper-binding protein CopC
VAIPAGAFKDKAGNNFAGLAAGSWNFTVKPAPVPVDKTPPRVTARQPANNDNNVPVNARLVLDFDEKVKKGQGAIVLTQGSNTENIEVTSEQVDVAGSKVTISHANDFAYDAPVTVAIAAGVFVDENGNAFEGTSDWTFRTAEPPAPVDNTAPTVAELTPANGVTNIPVSTNSLQITFNENINKGTGNITITGTGFTKTVVASETKVAGRKATIDLDQPFPYATAISVAVPQGAFTDETGNAFTGLAASAWTFTTVDAPAPTDNTAPVVSGLSPADNATGVAENAKLEITFSEEVVAATGNITITPMA